MSRHHIKTYEPVYNTTKEWTKDFKFNGHWYSLKSIFDMDLNPDKLDFNQSIDNTDDTYLNSIENIVEPLETELYPIVRDLDFNSALMETLKKDYYIIKYGLDPIFETLNESSLYNSSDISSIKSLVNKVFSKLENINKKDVAKKLADYIKSLWKLHGTKVVILSMGLISLYTGTASATMLRGIENYSKSINNDTVIDIQSSIKDIIGGGLEYNSEEVSNFINTNFHNLEKLEKLKLVNDISNYMLEGTALLISTPHNKLKDALAELNIDGIKIIKTIYNKDTSNTLGKFLALAIIKL